MGNEWYGEYDEVCADGWITPNDDYYDADAPVELTEEEIAVLRDEYDNFIASLEPGYEK